MTRAEVITVSDLAKQYRIGAAETRHSSLREAIRAAVANPMARVRRWSRRRVEDRAGAREDLIWALSDVTFAAREGDVLALIGRNGSGKSTLLKVLAGITPPTRGKAVLRGRVGSLLQVGTGFHQELTGRENVLLSGAILGMGRREVAAKLDEIVEFSGVARFLDTPVKHYSTGMYLRLGFSVAVHMETEIVLVDEVLAVGDATFQRRCLDKMTEIARGGRTVVFVSHNLAAVTRLCDRGIVLEGGRVVADGTAVEAVRFYSQELVAEEPEGQSSRALVVHSMRVMGSTGTASAAPGQEWRLEFELEAAESFDDLSLRLSVRDTESLVVAHARTDPAFAPSLARPGRYHVSASLPALWLAPGEYAVQVKAIADGVVAAKVRAESDPFLVSVVSEDAHDVALPGVLHPACAWVAERVPAEGGA